MDPTCDVSVTHFLTKLFQFIFDDDAADAPMTIREMGSTPPPQYL